MYSRKNRLKQKIYPLVAFVLLISLWHAFDYIFNIRSIILPNPLEIFFVIINNFEYLIKHTAITSIEALLGFVLGSCLGFLSAISFTYSSLLKKSFYPYAICFKAIPVIALAPLLIMWFGSGILSKVIMAGIICYFPVLVGTVKGLSSVTKDQLDLFRLLNASEWQIFLKLRIPTCFSYLFPALKISATFSVVGATIAEFTGASFGIGYIIVNSSYYLETGMMFAAIVMISMVGLLFFYLVEFVERKVLFW